MQISLIVELHYNETAILLVVSLQIVPLDTSHKPLASLFEIYLFSIMKLH